MQLLTGVLASTPRWAIDGAFPLTPTMTSLITPATAGAHLRRILMAHGPSLQRMASSWTRSSAERDDLMQDIAVALLTALPTFRGECPERAFVWRVAHNQALAGARKRKRTGGTDGDEVLAVQASTTPSPVELSEQRQQSALLQQGLRLLREEQRLLVVLALEGLSHDEIAAVVGKNANAVGVALHRAKQALVDVCTSLSTPQTPTDSRRST